MEARRRPVLAADDHPPSPPPPPTPLPHGELLLPPLSSSPQGRSLPPGLQADVRTPDALAVGEERGNMSGREGTDAERDVEYESRNDVAHESRGVTCEREDDREHAQKHDSGRDEVVGSTRSDPKLDAGEKQGDPVEGRTEKRPSENGDDANDTVNDTLHTNSPDVNNGAAIGDMRKLGEASERTLADKEINKTENVEGPEPNHKIVTDESKIIDEMTANCTVEITTVQTDSIAELHEAADSPVPTGELERQASDAITPVIGKLSADAGTNRAADADTSAHRMVTDNAGGRKEEQVDEPGLEQIDGVEKALLPDREEPASAGNAQQLVEDVVESKEPMQLSRQTQPKGLNEAQTNQYLHAAENVRPDESVAPEPEQSSKLDKLSLIEPSEHEGVPQSQRTPKKRRTLTLNEETDDEVNDAAEDEDDPRDPDADVEVDLATAAGAELELEMDVDAKMKDVHESSRRLLSLDKPRTTRRRTRSQGAVSPRRLRRRNSEPAPAPAPMPKRTPKKRKPGKGDRVRVLWHVDNVFYEGVIDDVLVFRGKRYYDVTYDSAEREYYVDFTVRKWRFVDGSGNEEQDDMFDDSQLADDEELDVSKWPKRGDKVMIMWHVDGKYYPGEIRDTMRVNQRLFHDITYERGDEEFFLDLKVRKWRYRTEEHESSDALDDRIEPSSKPAKWTVKSKSKSKTWTKRTLQTSEASHSVILPPRSTRATRSSRTSGVDGGGLAGHRRRTRQSLPSRTMSPTPPSSPPNLPTASSSEAVPPSFASPSPMDLEPLPPISPGIERTEPSSVENFIRNLMEDALEPSQLTGSEQGKRSRRGGIDDIAEHLVQRQQQQADEQNSAAPLLSEVDPPPVDTPVYQSPGNESEALSTEQIYVNDQSKKSPRIQNEAIKIPPIANLRVLVGEEESPDQVERELVCISNFNAPHGGNFAAVCNVQPLKKPADAPVEFEGSQLKAQLHAGIFVKAQEPAPEHQGVIDARQFSYQPLNIVKSADERYPNAEDWKKKRDYVMEKSVEDSKEADHGKSTLLQYAGRGKEVQVPMSSRRLDMDEDTRVEPSREVPLRSSNEFAATHAPASLGQIVSCQPRRARRGVLAKHSDAGGQFKVAGSPSYGRRSESLRRSHLGSRVAKGNQFASHVARRSEVARPVEPVSSDVMEIANERRRPKTRVSDIVSVAGLVAKKWATDEFGVISSSIRTLDRQVSYLKKLHVKTDKARQKRQSEIDREDAEEELRKSRIPTREPSEEDVDLDEHLGDLKVRIVDMLAHYRKTVENRERKLKRQFLSLRNQSISQNAKLVEAAKTMRTLDHTAFKELEELQPSLKETVAASLRPEPTDFSHIAPIASASKQPRRDVAASPGPGNDSEAVTRNLRRKLAVLTTRTDFLADEVKRLQGREKELMKGKGDISSNLPSVVAKENPIGQVDRQAGGGDKGTKPIMLPPSKVLKNRAQHSRSHQPAPAKLTGISKKRNAVNKGLANRITGRQSGRANRKSLTPSNSKYTPPFSAAKQSVSAASKAPKTKGSVSMDVDVEIPSVAGKDKMPKNFPTQLLKQIDTQAAELLALVASVWLLQDEGRTEPPKKLGEKQNTWVASCIKDALRHALKYLSSCQGIGTAKKKLLEDVEGENINTDWILAESDAGIEAARTNYSLWDPTLQDVEWQVEKRVLAGLNVSLRTAMDQTTAGRFSATILYAQEIARKALADFERVMTDNPGLGLSPRKQVLTTSSSILQSIMPATGYHTPGPQLSADLYSSTAKSVPAVSSLQPKVSPRQMSKITPSVPGTKLQTQPQTILKNPFYRPAVTQGASSTRFGPRKVLPSYQQPGSAGFTGAVLYNEQLAGSIEKALASVPKAPTPAPSGHRSVPPEGSDAIAHKGRVATVRQILPTSARSAMPFSTTAPAADSESSKAADKVIPSLQLGLFPAQPPHADNEVPTIGLQSSASQATDASRPGHHTNAGVSKVTGDVEAIWAADERISKHSSETVSAKDREAHTNDPSPGEQGAEKEKSATLPKLSSDEEATMPNHDNTQSKGQESLLGDMVSSQPPPETPGNQKGDDYSSSKKDAAQTSAQPSHAVVEPKIAPSVTTVPNQILTTPTSVEVQSVKGRQGDALLTKADKADGTKTLGDIVSTQSKFRLQHPEGSHGAKSQEQKPQDVQSADLAKPPQSKAPSKIRSRSTSAKTQGSRNRVPLKKESGFKSKPVKSTLDNPSSRTEATQEQPSLPAKPIHSVRAKRKAPSTSCESDEISHEPGSTAQMTLPPVPHKAATVNTPQSSRPSVSDGSEETQTRSMPVLKSFKGVGPAETMDVSPFVQSSGLDRPGVTDSYNKPTNPSLAYVERETPFLRNSPSPSTKVRRTSQITLYQAAAKKKQVGFKSIPAPARKDVGEGIRPATAPFDPKTTHSVSPVDSAPSPPPQSYNDGLGQGNAQDYNVGTPPMQDLHRDRDRVGELQQPAIFGSGENAYGTCNPSNAAIMNDRQADLAQADLINPSTPSSFPGLDNYISLSDNVGLKRLPNDERESLPATPSDFPPERPFGNALSSPINFDRSYPATDPFIRNPYQSSTGMFQQPSSSAGPSGINRLINPQQQQQPFGSSTGYAPFQPARNAFQPRGPFQRGSR